MISSVMIIECQITFYGDGSYLPWVFRDDKVMESAGVDRSLLSYLNGSGTPWGVEQLAGLSNNSSFYWFIL